MQTSSQPTRAEVWVGKISLLAAWMGGLATLAMVAITIVDVIGRSVFGTSFRGVYEITQVLLVPAVFAGLAEATRSNSQVVVDLIDAVLDKHILKALQRIAEAVTLGVICVLIWMGFSEARQAYIYGDITPDLRLSVVWLWTALLAGLGVGAVVSLYRLLSGRNS